MLASARTRLVQYEKGSLADDNVGGDQKPDLYLNLEQLKMVYHSIDVGSADPYAIAAALGGSVEGPPTEPPRDAPESAVTPDSGEFDPSASVLPVPNAPTPRLRAKQRIGGIARPIQGYLDPAPNGIDARFAWNHTKGIGITLADIERGWVEDHLELQVHGIKPQGCQFDFRGHGAAVLGIVAAEHDFQDCLGIAPDLAILAISQWNSKQASGKPCYSTAQAIAAATTQLKWGDILLIEAQTIEPGSPYFLPVEIEIPVFHAIQEAVANGIVVVEAAGNGGIDLDEWAEISGDRPFRRRTKELQDSGAILVGASTPPGHTRAQFSNYGSRIDCFAWGSKVFTAGSGRQGKSKSDYVADFTGTSAAAAIIAGAAALVQSLAKSQNRVPLFNSKTMRSFLANPNHGTLSADPQADQIGVMPDLKRIFAALGVP